MSTMTTLSPEATETPARSPLGELLGLAIPTVAQMASYTVMQFLDTWMLSRLGVNEPTAAGNGGLLAWSVMGFGAGVLFCVNALVSQHFGQKDFRACGRYLWQGVWFALLYALLTSALIPAAPRIFTWMGHDPALIAAEGTFFRITVGGAAIKLAATAFGQFLLATNRPWIVLASTVCGVLANIGVNYLLIYGNFGFPRLGVAGAAWGTNVGVTVELCILMAVAMRPAMRRTFNTLDWPFRPASMRTLLGIGLPSGFQIIADIAAWMLFQTWVMGQFGTAAMAANTFAFRYLSVSFMPAFGISIAVTALVGRYIGAGKPNVAARRAHLGFAVAAIYMLVCGALYILGRNVLMGLFTRDPEVLRLGMIVLVFCGIYQLFDAMYIVYNGALRGAGDTFVPAVTLFVLCWGIMVGGGYAVARMRPQWGVVGPWTMASVYGAILGGFILARFCRGRWQAIRLETQDASDTVRGFEPLPAAAAAAEAGPA
jgi:MATE family multidrug resistance protein